jgi:hypothetical protein
MLHPASRKYRIADLIGLWSYLLKNKGDSLLEMLKRAFALKTVVLIECELVSLIATVECPAHGSAIS